MGWDVPSVKELGHVLAASGVGARIDLGRLPCSRTLADHFEENRRWELQLGGGDDYELCFTAPASSALEIEQAMAALELPATVVGQVEADAGLRLFTPEGGAWTPPARGYQHFEGGHA